MTELEESNRQFIASWQLFARRSARGEVLEVDGVAVAFSRVAMPLMNMMFLSSPVADVADLRRRVDAAVAYGRASGHMWMLTVCDEWLPPAARTAAPALLAAAGLAPSSVATGMVADELAAPRRPIPDVAIRPVDTGERRTHVADLNTAAYGMPAEWGREALDREQLFTDGIWGDVAYLGAEPVSTSTTALVDGRLYVMMVATAAGHRNRGYAEAAMRSSLARAAQASGARRTVLHASDAGAPLYAQMGYRTTGRFTMYLAGADGHAG